MGGLLVCVIMCAVREAGPADCYQRAEERGEECISIKCSFN